MDFEFIIAPFAGTFWTLFIIFLMISGFLVYDSKLRHNPRHGRNPAE